MKDAILLSVILAVVLLSSFFIEKYQYDDCKAVGHSTMYCILKIGK